MRAPFSPHDVDAIFFDLDGTLMDSDDASVGAWERRLAKARLRREKAAGLARRIVMLLETPFNFTLSVADWLGLDALYIRLAQGVLGEWAAGGPHPPVDGVAGLLAGLAARYRLAVVSTRSAREVEAFLASAGILGSIETVVGHDTVRRIKPHPLPLLRAAETLEVSIERVVMVGDTTPDMRAARRAGAWAVGVLCGYGERPELERAGAHIVLDHTRDVAALLQP